MSIGFKFYKKDQPDCTELDGGKQEKMSYADITEPYILHKDQSQITSTYGCRQLKIRSLVSLVRHGGNDSWENKS